MYEDGCERCFSADCFYMEKLTFLLEKKQPVVALSHIKTKFCLRFSLTKSILLAS